MLSKQTLEKQWKVLRKKAAALPMDVYIWLGVLVLYFGVYLLATGLDLLIQGHMSYGQGSLEPEAAYNEIQGMSRSLGQLLGLALTCLAIALPVTANLYTPRLIKLFMTDRLNLFMLAMLMLVLVHNVWAYLALRHVVSMQFILYLTLILFFFTLSLLIPYFGYMAKYFNPSFLLLKMERDILEKMQAIHQTKRYHNAMRVSILINLDNIGNMVLKSISRTDREVATAGVQVLRRLLGEYVELKPGMPAAWQELDYSRFPGMSTEGLTEVNRRQIWFELLILRYLDKAFSSSLNLMQDLVSDIASQNQHVGLMYLMRSDQEVVMLCIRSFNTYLAHTMEYRDLQSIHNVLYHYSSFAAMLMSFDAKLVREVARHIRFQATQGMQEGISHVMDVALYELIRLTYLAKTNREEELYDYLCYIVTSVKQSSSEIETRGINRAKVVFAGMLLEQADEKNLLKLWPQLERITPQDLKHFYAELVTKNDKIQSEITDRFISFAYLHQGHQQALISIFQKLGFAPALASASPA